MKMVTKSLTDVREEIIEKHEGDESFSDDDLRKELRKYGFFYCDTCKRNTMFWKEGCAEIQSFCKIGAKLQFNQVIGEKEWCDYMPNYRLTEFKRLKKKLNMSNIYYPVAVQRSEK